MLDYTVIVKFFDWYLTFFWEISFLVCVPNQMSTLAVFDKNIEEI